MATGEMAQYDSIVIGAGIIGSATAYSLARRGCCTLLLEQFALPHSRGSSHGQSRIIRKAYPQPYYANMMVEAYEAWGQLEKETHTELIKQTGLLVFGDAAIDYTRQVERSLASLNTPYRRYSTTELREKFPMFRFDPGQVGVYDQQAGLIRADRAILSYQTAFRNNGGTLKEEEVVDSVIPGDIATVKTSKREYTAKSIVITIGAWTAKLSKSLGLRLPLQVIHTRVCYLKQRENVHTVDAGMPCFIYCHTNADAQESLENTYGFPCVEYPNQVKVACHGGQILSDPDFRDISSPLDQTIVQTIEAFAQRHLPGVIPKVGIIEHCMYTLTPDEDFILDVHPRWNNIVIGAGFSGHGFKFAPVVGKVLAELATDRRPSYDLRPFRIDRFGADVTKSQL